MNYSPLDLERLAVRVEALQRTRTQGWDSGDELEFKNRLPTGRERPERKLPASGYLRQLAMQAKAGQDSPPVVGQMWRYWIQTALTLEGLVGQNDPRNPKRMMRDMARGKIPRFAKKGKGGVVHTKKDEHKWEKAVEIATEHFGHKPKGDEFGSHFAAKASASRVAHRSLFDV